MGDSLKMNKLLVFALLATAVFAIPADDVVSEDAVVAPAIVAQPSEVDETMELMQVQAEARALVAKKGKNACRDLATATEDEVKKNIAAFQQALDKINKGKDCLKKGSKLVGIQESALTKAKTTLKNAKAKKKKADEEKLDFGKFQANQLNGNSCSSFYNTAVWKKSKQKRKEARTAMDRAQGSMNTAKKALQDAKNQAAKDITKCQCAVRRNHKSSLEEANKKAYNANIKAWTKAAHIKCAIDGKSKCNVPPMPKVKKVSVAKGVTQANCNQEKLLTTNNGCGGIIYCKKQDTASTAKLIIQLYESTTWNKNHQYNCPDGFYWPTKAQYTTAVPKLGCWTSNAGTTVYNKCGFKGYTGPDGKGRTYVRFADSKSNGGYQHVGGGWSGSSWSNDYNTNSFAGIVCLKKGWNVGGHYNGNGHGYNRNPNPWGPLSGVPNYYNCNSPSHAPKNAPNKMNCK